MRSLSILPVAAIAVCSVLCSAQPESYRVVRAHPHDQSAFTQGLVYVDGHIYESTGLVGHSSLRMENIETGRILQFHDVPGPYFAEGLTEWRDKLIQLTWQSHKGFVYDRFTFKLVKTFPLDGEGWGLTQNGVNLIVSDGTATLRFLDPENFKVVRRLTVRDNGHPVTQLNELEFIHGEIFANVWHTNRIARINPKTGKVIAWIDLTGLMPGPERENPEAVLNGIAYDPVRDRLFVTGKYWPEIFEIKVIPEETSNAVATSKHHK
ncbi:MAG: glutaminyl-peptide cyclotransferase [Acidobacteriota bacterium]|nr:glutaminyl-peptide cyclotransferase [Acidobacteriota bacterium]